MYWNCIMKVVLPENIRTLRTGLQQDHETSPPACLGQVVAAQSKLFRPKWWKIFSTCTTARRWSTCSRHYSRPASRWAGRQGRWTGTLSSTWFLQTRIWSLGVWLMWMHNCSISFIWNKEDYVKNATLMLQLQLTTASFTLL